MAKIDRNKVHEKCNGRCGYCGMMITVKEMQVDHIVAQWSTMSQERCEKVGLTKGTNDFNNLMPACRVCNKAKDVFSIEGFREQLSLQLERANNYSANYRMAKRYGQVVEAPKPIVFYFETIKNVAGETRVNK